MRYIIMLDTRAFGNIFVLIRYSESTDSGRRYITGSQRIFPKEYVFDASHITCLIAIANER